MGQSQAPIPRGNRHGCASHAAPVGYDTKPWLNASARNSIHTHITHFLQHFTAYMYAHLAVCQLQRGQSSRSRTVLSWQRSPSSHLHGSRQQLLLCVTHDGAAAVHRLCNLGVLRCEHLYRFQILTGYGPLHVCVRSRRAGTADRVGSAVR